MEDIQPVASSHSIADSFSPFHEIVFVTIVCMAQFLTQVNIGACLATLDILADSFGIEEPEILPWFIAGYSLTVGTFILVFGRLGDFFGYHHMFLIGLTWLAVWSLVAGLSVYSTYELFIFARVMQGLGPAMLLPNGLAILGVTYRPGRRKNMIFSLFAAAAPNGALLGAVFSSLFSQLLWWPWTYWAMAIVSIVCDGLGSLYVPVIPHTRCDHLSIWRLMQLLDIPGAACGISGLVLINVAWNQAPIVGWETPYVYVLLVIGILLIIVFMMVELHYSSHPLVPKKLFTPDVGYVMACIACGWGCFGIWIYYFWRFLETLRNVTPLLASAQFVPAGIVGFMSACVTGYLMHHISPGWIMFLSKFAFTVGCVLTAIAPVDQKYWALTFVSLLIIPWGMDMSFPAATLMLSDVSSRDEQGVEASLVTAVVNYAIYLSLGFASTVEVQIAGGGHSSEDVLRGYRAALYLAVGLGGLGAVMSIVYLLRSRRHKADEV